MRETIERYILENGLSRAEFATLVDINRSYISTYLSGGSLPNGTAEKIEERFLELIRPTKTAAATSDFLRTADAMGVIAVCQSCQDYMGMGILIGRSGFGKTYALKYYAKGAKVCYIECNESMTARDLIKAMERAIGLPHLSGSIDDRLDTIKEFFNANRGYLLIIDEADKLITKHTQKKAEILRNIFDQADMGLVLAGEPALEKMVRTYIPRMANRIDFHFELSGLLNDEVREYTAELELDEEAQGEILRRATNSKNGCFRLLNRTWENVKRIATYEEVVGIDTVQQASAMMMI